MPNGKTSSTALFVQLIECTSTLIRILNEETAEVKRGDLPHASLRIGSKSRELNRLAVLMHKMLRLDPEGVAKVHLIHRNTAEQHLREFWTARLENLTALTAALLPFDPGARPSDTQNFITLSRSLVDFEQPEGEAKIISFQEMFTLLRNDEPPSES